MLLGPVRLQRLVLHLGRLAKALHGLGLGTAALRQSRVRMAKVVP